MLLIVAGLACVENPRAVASSCYPQQPLGFSSGLVPADADRNFC